MFAQVLPDWTSSVAKPKDVVQREVVAASERRKMATSLKALLSVDAEHAAAVKSKADEEDCLVVEEQARTCNRDFMVRLSNQLARGSGINIMDFVPKVKLGPLSADDERIRKLAKCPLMGAERYRSVIRNMETGKERYELPIVLKGGVRFPKIWHSVMDLGTKGDPAMSWFDFVMGAKGTQLRRVSAAELLSAGAPRLL